MKKWIFDLCYWKSGEAGTIMAVAISPDGGSWRSQEHSDKEGWVASLAGELMQQFPAQIRTNTEGKMVICDLHMFNLSDGRNRAGQDYPMILNQE